ncbi:hypothetical protein ACSBOX_08110 [Arthrobacter sp. KN11-1C]|uniref:hypothetical protein n=1 Tax=Arthrobacter sp. KN11-1C TaxID=3445774 RepID=UPI003F9FE52D
MTVKVNVLSIFAAIALLIFPAQGATASPTFSNPVHSDVTFPSSKTDQAIEAAIDEAFAGSDQDLVSLLHSPEADATRTALRARLEARGDFQFIPPFPQVGRWAGLYMASVL